MICQWITGAVNWPQSVIEFIRYTHIGRDRKWGKDFSLTNLVKSAIHSPEIVSEGTLLVKGFTCPDTKWLSWPL
jgi:hypothetical protein